MNTEALTLEAQIGPRGQTKVTTENRGLVKRWLTASGTVPAVRAREMTVAEMSAAYNGTTTNQEITVTAAAAPTATADVSSDAAKLAELISRIGGANKAIDAAEVLKIVDARLAEVATVKHVVEIQQEGRETVRVEGQHKTFPRLLRAMSARMANGRAPFIFLSGPTGSGKTHSCEEAAKALGRKCFVLGAATMDHQLIGFRDAHGNFHSTPFIDGYTQPSVIVLDEFDSYENSPLMAVMAALANGGFQSPDGYKEMHPDCIVIACGNTWGQGATADFVGRTRIDAAILSRFPVRIFWDYDHDLETAISGNAAWAGRVQASREKARSHGLKVIIDPRVSQAGAALIAAGFSADEAAEMTYLATLPEAQRKQIA